MHRITTSDGVIPILYSSSVIGAGVLSNTEWSGINTASMCDGCVALTILELLLIAPHMEWVILMVCVICILLLFNRINGSLFIVVHMVLHHQHEYDLEDKE